MDRTRLLKREILVFQPIFGAFQMLSSSLLKDALVIAILFLISAVPPSSLVTLAPRYVNLSTSFASLFLTLRLALLLLFTFIHVYIYRISWHSASSQLLLSCLQALLSSAKPRSSSIEVKFKRIPVFSFLTVCCITQSIIIIEKRNKKPDMQQPCLTPVIKEKGAVTLYLVVLNRKALKTSYRALSILIGFLGGIPYFSISGHQVECFLKVHKMDVHGTCSIPLTVLLQDVIENKDLMQCNQYRIVFC